MGFARVDGRAVVADFDGGAITSNAGGLLLGATDRAIGLVERFAACFADGRAAERVVHEVATLVGQRVFGIALGYEDLVDHDRLRHDPVLGVVLGRLEARHGRCAPLAGKSTLNRLEHGARGSRPLPPDRPRRRGDRGAVRGPVPRRPRRGRRRRSCSTSTPPTIPLHGHQEGRFFHGYYIPEDEAREALLQLDPLWDELFPAEQARIVQLLVDRVDVGTAGVRVHLRTNGLAGLVREVGGTGRRVAA